MTRFGYLLVGTLAWGVLAFGAVYPWAYWPLFAASAGLGTWGIVRTRAWQDPRMRTIGVSLFVLVTAILIQTIALPYWLLGHLSPGVDRFFREFMLGYHPAALHPLSLAPEATWVVAAEALSLSLLLIGVARTVKWLSLEWIVSQLMGLGVALAVIGILQKALGGSEHVLVYGFWRTIDGGNPFGPFVNRNHFAGWMAMVLPVVAAYAFGVAQAAGRPQHGGFSSWLRWGSSVGGNRLLLVVSAVLVMGVALVLTGSRSGVASFAVGIITLAWFVARRLRSGRQRLVAAGYFAVVLAGAIAWAGSDMVFARFQRAPGEIHGRFGAWRDTGRIIGDFPVFGVGLGSYRSAMLVYQTADRDTMYAQAHNDYLQLVAEGGLLVTVPAVVTLGIMLFSIRRRLRSDADDDLTYWIRRGAVSGLVAIAAQSAVEFSLQMPGNAVLFTVLAGVALHRPRSTHHARRV
jgi:O-antigen ligase